MTAVTWCSHCQLATEVARFRLADVGLRHLCSDCFQRLDAMGMAIYRVTDTDPRLADRGRAARAPIADDYIDALLGRVPVAERRRSA